MTPKSVIEKPPVRPSKLYELIAGEANGFIYLRKLDGKLVYVSPSVERILGFSPTQFVGNFAAHLATESAINDAAVASWKKGLNNAVPGMVLPSFFLEFITKDERRTIHEVFERVVAQGKNEPAVIGISVDVSEQYRALEELKRGNQELAVIRHTQSHLLGVNDRDQLFSAALVAALTMLEFENGAVFELDLVRRTAVLVSSRGVDDATKESLANFPLPEQLIDQSFGVGIRTNAILLPPGHSWLQPLSPLGSSVAGLILVCQNVPVAVVAASCARTFTRETGRLFQLIGSLVSHSIENAYLHHELEKLSITDPETGLFNRTYISILLNHEDQLIKRYTKSASLVFIAVENADGSQIGVSNSAISTTAAILRACTRSTDLVARFRDTMFLVYLPETGYQGTRSMIQRCITEVHRISAAEGLTLNLLVGAASSEHGEHSVPAMLEAAENDLKPIDAP